MSDYDLVVIGAGFWGTAAALKARERGMDTLVLDNGVPWSASRNAAGMIHPDWFKGSTIGKMVPPGWSGTEIGQSIQWLMRYGLQNTGETFNGPKGERRHPETFMLNDVAGFLSLASAKRAEVSHVRRLRDGGWRIYADSESVSVDAKQLIIAAGASTDTLLEASSLPRVGVGRLRGRGLVISTRTLKVPDLPYRIQVRPYLSYTLRPWPGGLYRFGDTTEPTKDFRKMRDMVDALNGLVGSYGVVETHEGDRPVAAQFIVRPVADGCVVATGGHRVGLGVAGVAAEKALQLLKAKML